MAPVLGPPGKAFGLWWWGPWFDFRPLDDEKEPA